MLRNKLAPFATALILFSALPALAGPADPQQPAVAKPAEETPTFYNLVFRVIDRDGKRIVSSHSYKTSTGIVPRNDWNASIDSRDVFSIPNGPNDRRIGFHVRAMNPRVVEGKLAVYLDGSMSSLPTDETSTAAAPTVVVRSNDFQAWVLLPMNAPTIVYSSDDPSSTHVFEVELTASPMETH